MRSLSLAALCWAAFAWASLPEEGVGLAPQEASPFVVECRVEESSEAGIALHVFVRARQPSPPPSVQPHQVGLVAIPPTGRVEATVLRAAATPGPQPRTEVDPSQVPPDLVQLGEPAIWRDLRVVEVFVRPCWLEGDTVWQLREVQVHLTPTPAQGPNEKSSAPRPVSPLWDALYRAHVLNYDWLQLPKLTRGTGNRYLVISRNAFATQAQQFAEWKTRQGYGVQVVTLESLGYSGSSITSTACLNATKNYILNAYQTWPDGLDFVVLLGDMESSNNPNYDYPGSIWTQTFYNYFYNQGQRPHDQWYGFLEGNDLFADVMVGRLPASTASDMAILVSKTVNYEKTPYLEGTWQKRAIMTLNSGISETIQVKNLVSDLLAAWGMNVLEYFSSPWNVIPAINQGLTFYNYRGDYCSENSWGGTFDTYDVPYVNNPNKPGVWTVISCSSGSFDLADAILAERLLRLGSTTQSKGAVAFIGSQAYTAYEYNNPMDEGFYRAWTDSGVSLLGQAFLSGKIWAWNHMYPGFDPNRRDCMMREYTILGDPSLQVWTNVPQATQVSVSPPTLVAGQTQAVTITVTRPGVGPVPQALVCLRKSPDVYVWAYTGANGQVSLSASPTSSGVVDLTVTAYNQQPFLGTIEVVSSSGPHVVYDSSTILGDGAADIGDTVLLTIQLRNVGTQTAAAVQATLRTANPAITVLDSTRAFGDIPPGATALSASPFTFRVGSMADGSVVAFGLAISSGDSLWNSSFSVGVRAPNLSVVGTLVDDQWGNNNGRLDPGETVSLRLQVRNTGSGPAQGLVLSLSGQDPYVSVSGTPSQAMGTVASGATVTSPPFTVFASPTTPGGYTATLTALLVANAATLQQSSPVNLTVGLRPLLFVDADDEATEGAITDALASLGRTYDRWNTYQSGMAVVPADTLKRYRIVLWAAGDQNQSSVTPDNQATLGAYLDQGGNLILSAENYSTSYASATFSSSYLHVGSFGTTSGSTVVGTAGDPIGGGCTVSLTYHPDLSNTPDRVDPGVGAAVVFSMQGTNDPVAIRYPSSGTGTYKVVFFGVPLEAFSPGSAPNDIATVVARCLAWMEGDVVPPTAPSNVSLSPSGVLSWSPATDNVGVTAYRVYGSTTPYFQVLGMLPLVSTTGTSVQLTTGFNDPAAEWSYRVTAQDAAGNESAPSPTVGEREFALP